MGESMNTTTAAKAADAVGEKVENERKILVLHTTHMCCLIISTGIPVISTSVFIEDL